MKLVKRIFDLVCTIPGVLVLSPLMLLLALLVKLEDGGPVFFAQERVGHRGRHFRMLKFRSMVVDAEKRGLQITVGRDPRVTRIGHFLRNSKLDELPQLLNVLSGDMSLVGPRPEVPKYVAMYNEEQRKVLDLMPGITDPASIEFRHESELLAKSTHPEQTYVQEIMPLKIKINLEYARKSSLQGDFVIILQTFAKIFR